MDKRIEKQIISLAKKNDWSWEKHIRTVVKYSKILAKKTNADLEVCETAAWLHDIMKIKGCDKEHHIKGSVEAGKILTKYGYDPEKIKKIQDCIITHSSDERYPPLTKEAKVLASADALSHFVNFWDLAYFAANYYDTIEESRKYLIKKMESCRKKLIPEAKEFSLEPNEAIMFILEKHK